MTQFFAVLDTHDWTLQRRNLQATKGRLAQGDRAVSLKLISHESEGSASSEAVIALIGRQVQPFKSLDNCHLLSPLGLTSVADALFLVHPWCERGNLRQYLLDHSDTNTSGGIEIVSGA